MKYVGKGLDLFFGISVVSRDLLGQAVGQFGKVEFGQVALDGCFGQGEGVRFRGGLGGRGRAGGHFDGDLRRLAAKIDGQQLDAVGLGRAVGGLGRAASGVGRALGGLGRSRVELGERRRHGEREDVGGGEDEDSRESSMAEPCKR